ncbi:DinB family protein [Pleomorphovibrio marinus]|uniref:DinB family protein n=1 Tax=Pleomorphovibrio marinus TaxID=2164132 RepID=UPI000E0AB853|nr:DinB family protein [Pleomorphovibrio marinus]
MDTAYFSEIFQYNEFVNEKWINAIQDAEAPAPRVFELMNHILNAHAIWNSRIAGKTPKVEVWGIRKQNLHSQFNHENHLTTLLLMEGIDLGSSIDYKNSKGVRFSNTYRDILFHLINHSTYHRGQIAIFFRNSGLEPVNSDYVFWKRSKK